MAVVIRPKGVGELAHRSLLLTLGSHLETVTNELGDQPTPEKPDQPLLLNDLLRFHHPTSSGDLSVLYTTNVILNIGIENNIW
jgi:hypothetical protein